jgi:Phosphotransferase enzyme family
MGPAEKHVFVPEIADERRMTEIIKASSERLGLGPLVGAGRLVEAQIRHSHRPNSPRCTGWATYTVPADSAGRPSVLLYVRGYPDGTSEQEWADLVASGRARGATRIEDQDLIVWVFPDDPCLPALAALVDPERIASRLPAERVPELLARTITAGDVELDVVRYQPETSATVRYRIAVGRVEDPVVLYAKAIDADPSNLGTLQDRLWVRSADWPELRIAQPLGSDPELRVLWTLGVPGTPVRPQHEPAAAASLARAVARTVAALHRSGVRPSHVIRWEDLLAEGRKKAAKLAEALPRCRSAVAAIAPRDGRYEPAVNAPATVHGDLHLEQIIDGPDGLVLVDLDSVASGDAEVDLAELVVDVVLRSVSIDAVDAFVSALLESYERHAAAQIRLGLLRALADAEFLTRCHRHLRRRAPGWELALERALDRHAVLAAALPTRG